MGSTLKKHVEKSFLHSKNNIIIDVNKEFIELTSFTMKELLGKSISQLIGMLRINSNIFFENNTKKCTCYIFTKTFEVKEVSVTHKVLSCENESVYYFKVKGKLPFQESFPCVNYLLKDNKYGIAIYSVIDLVLLTANQKSLNRLNYPNNSIANNIGKKLRDRLNGFDSNNGEDICKEIIRTGNAYYEEEREYQTLDSEITYWDISVIPVSIDGEVKYLFETVSDVTERVSHRKIIEEQSKKIEEQKKELEAIVENISDSISIIDHKGNHKLFNKNAREMFLPPKEYLGDTHSWYKDSELFYFNGDKIPPENYPENRILRGETFSKFRVSAKFPNKLVHLDVSGTPIYDNEGKLILGVICNRDITEYYKQAEILKSRNEFLDRLIDKLELPVISISCPDLKVLELNQKAFDIMKAFRPAIKSAIKIKGNIITDIFPELKESEYFHKINEVLKEKKIKTMNKKTHLINGNEVYWNVIFEPIFELNGEVAEIIVLLIDITTEIKSNKLMEKALESQEEFLANISHELKTPLNVIYSTIQLFNLYCKNGSLDQNKDSIFRYIHSMMQNCYRLSKLINNIVDLSKIKAGFFKLNLSNNNIVEVVEEIVMSVTDYTDVKGLSIIFDTDIEEKIIACDPEMIERIVLNLISNAIKFSDAGNEILVNIEDKNEFIEISVKDNGIGIEYDQLDMIFNRFKQVDKSLSRNAEGTGIGLSLVKAIVEMHQGRIYVESQFEKGSKFTVVLPTKKVVQENMFPSSNITNKTESLQVELSDIS